MQWKCKHTRYVSSSWQKNSHVTPVQKKVIMSTCAQNTNHQKRQSSTARNSNYVKIHWAKKPNSGTERCYRTDQRVGGRLQGSAFQRATGKIGNKLRVLIVQKCCNSTPRRRRVSRGSSGALQGSSEVLRSCPHYCRLGPHTTTATPVLKARHSLLLAPLPLIN